MYLVEIASYWQGLQTDILSFYAALIQEGKMIMFLVHHWIFNNLLQPIIVSSTLINMFTRLESYISDSFLFFLNSVFDTDMPSDGL